MQWQTNTQVNRQHITNTYIRTPSPSYFYFHRHNFKNTNKKHHHQLKAVLSHCCLPFYPLQSPCTSSLQWELSLIPQKISHFTGICELSRLTLKDETLLARTRNIWSQWSSSRNFHSSETNDIRMVELSAGSDESNSPESPIEALDGDWVGRSEGNVLFRVPIGIDIGIPIYVRMFNSCMYIGDSEVGVRMGCNLKTRTQN